MSSKRRNLSALVFLLNLITKVNLILFNNINNNNNNNNNNIIIIIIIIIIFIQDMKNVKRQVGVKGCPVTIKNVI